MKTQVSIKREHPGDPGWGDPPYTSGILLSWDDQILTIFNGTLSRGVSKNGKKWNRWNNRSATFVSRKTGYLRVFQKSKVHAGYGQRSRSVVRDITASPLLAHQFIGPHGGFGGKNADQVEQWELALMNAFVTLGIPYNPNRPERGIWDAAYPLTKEANWAPMQGLSPGIRSDNLRGLIEGTLGKRNYRKDVARSLASAPSLDGLWLARELRNTVPIDWLVPVLARPFNRANDNWWDWTAVRGSLSANLARLPFEQRRGLTQDLTAAWIPDIIDTIRQLQQIPDAAEIPRVRTWRELHDEIAPVHRTYAQYQKNREIEPIKVAKKLDQLQIDNLTLKHAKDTDELLNWGREMSHCIGGYGSAAVAGRSALFGLYEGEQLVANLEIDPRGDVRQFYGRFNATPPDKIVVPVRKAIEQKVKAKA